MTAIPTLNTRSIALCGAINITVFLQVLQPQLPGSSLGAAQANMSAAGSRSPSATAGRGAIRSRCVHDSAYSTAAVLHASSVCSWLRQCCQITKSSGSEGVIGTFGRPGLSRDQIGAQCAWPAHCTTAPHMPYFEIASLGSVQKPAALQRASTWDMKKISGELPAKWHSMHVDGALMTALAYMCGGSFSCTVYVCYSTCVCYHWVAGYF